MAPVTDDTDTTVVEATCLSHTGAVMCDRVELLEAWHDLTWAF